MGDRRINELYPLFVTIHFIPAALAAARPIALSSTTTQLQKPQGMHFKLEALSILLENLEFQSYQDTRE